MINSPQNEKLKLIRKLHDRRHREREGLFFAEGEDVIAAGRDAGAEPAFVLVAASAGLEEIAPGALEVEPELLASASTLGSGTRAIGVFERRFSPLGGSVCVYLHGVADPGNVGAIVRSAHALVEGTVALGPGCADPFSPKAVRASMGSVFGQPIALADAADTPEPRLALVAHGGESLGDLNPPVTVCLGAERDGLPAEVTALCGRELTIPVRPGGAESLNVAAAAAIVLERLGSADA
jgi:TrmH family RNA methyltransferase